MSDKLELAVHDYSCGRCRAEKIVGTMYFCRQCESGFQLCESCFLNGTDYASLHMMQRVDAPICSEDRPCLSRLTDDQARIQAKLMTGSRPLLRCSVCSSAEFPINVYATPSSKTVDTRCGKCVPSGEEAKVAQTVWFSIPLQLISLDF